MKCHRCGGNMLVEERRAFRTRVRYVWYCLACGHETITYAEAA